MSETDLAGLLNDPAVIACPYPYYDMMRASQPVFEVPGIGYIVTAYEDVLTVLTSPDAFSSAFGAGFATTGLSLNPRPAAVDEILARGVPEVAVLTQIAGPTHRRHRRLVSQAFSARRVKQMEGIVAAVGEELLDRFAGRGSVELRTEFASALPMTVVAEALGVPRADLELFKRWSDGAHSLIGVEVPEDRYIAIAEDFLDFQRYFSARIAERRAAPSDDLLSDLVHAEEDDEAPLTEPELLNIIMQLLVAGNETTASTLCAGMLILARQPDLADRLRNDPDAIPRFVEELLRVESPIQGLPRVTLVDTELHGVALPAGATVIPLYGAGNRDPGQFPEPEAIRLERERITGHLAFSQGVHHCLGATLARAELRISLELLLARLRDIRLQPGHEPELLPSLMVRGLRELRLDFGSVER
ncbi:MAG TPA: cytochrome P450 [Pseudonocardia sp.]|nr:cytochrome P450 [Pseudonocardia sp.]